MNRATSTRTFTGDGYSLSRETSEYIWYYKALDRKNIHYIRFNRNSTEWISFIDTGFGTEDYDVDTEEDKNIIDSFAKSLYESWLYECKRRERNISWNK